MDKQSEDLNHTAMEIETFTEEEKKGSGKIFLGGMLFGMLTVMLVGVCVYVGSWLMICSR